MISRVKFENFKALQAVAIDLEPITVFVGANATGKTSVLQGLDAFTRFSMYRAAIPMMLAPFSDYMRTLGAAGDVAVSVTGDVAAELRVTPGPTDDPMPFDLTLTLGDEKVTGKGSNLDEWIAMAQGLASAGLSTAVRLRLDPQRLSAPSYVDDVHPRVASDGHGLASVLALARGEQSEAISRIEDDLRRIVPLARKLRILPARVKRNEREYITINGKSIENTVERTYIGQRFELEIEGVGSVPADMLSEGTLLVLGLLTVLSTTPGLRLLLLDDIERGLHPNAQRDVIKNLRAVVANDPGLQIVCTTHSPYSLDGFEPGEVRVLQLDARGRASCKALTDHPDWPRWRDYMNPGEFWSSVGEDWIFGERDGSA